MSGRRVGFAFFSVVVIAAVVWATFTISRDARRVLAAPSRDTAGDVQKCFDAYTRAAEVVIKTAQSGAPSLEFKSDEARLQHEKYLGCIKALRPEEPARNPVLEASIYEAVGDRYAALGHHQAAGTLYALSGQWGHLAAFDQRFTIELSDQVETAGYEVFVRSTGKLNRELGADPLLSGKFGVALLAAREKLQDSASFSDLRARLTSARERGDANAAAEWQRILLRRQALQRAGEAQTEQDAVIDELRKNAAYFERSGQPRDAWLALVAAGNIAAASGACDIANNMWTQAAAAFQDDKEAFAAPVCEPADAVPGMYKGGVKFLRLDHCERPHIPHPTAKDQTPVQKTSVELATCYAATLLVPEPSGNRPPTADEVAGWRLHAAELFMSAGDLYGEANVLGGAPRELLGDGYISLRANWSRRAAQIAEKVTEAEYREHHPTPRGQTVIPEAYVYYRAEMWRLAARNAEVAGRHAEAVDYYVNAGDVLDTYYRASPSNAARSASRTSKDPAVYYGFYAGTVAKDKLGDPLLAAEMYLRAIGASVRFGDPASVGYSDLARRQYAEYVFELANLTYRKAFTGRELGEAVAAIRPVTGRLATYNDHRDYASALQMLARAIREALQSHAWAGGLYAEAAATFAMSPDLKPADWGYVADLYGESGRAYQAVPDCDSANAQYALEAAARVKSGQTRGTGVCTAPDAIVSLPPPASNHLASSGASAIAPNTGAAGERGQSGQLGQSGQTGPQGQSGEQGQSGQAGQPPLGNGVDGPASGQGTTGDNAVRAVQPEGANEGEGKPAGGCGAAPPGTVAAGNFALLAVPLLLGAARLFQRARRDRE